MGDGSSDATPVVSKSKPCPTSVMALAELYNLSLHCIGCDGFHLRGFDGITTHDGDARAELQGRRLNPLPP